MSTVIFLVDHSGGKIAKASSELATFAKNIGESTRKSQRESSPKYNRRESNLLREYFGSEETQVQTIDPQLGLSVLPLQQLRRLKPLKAQLVNPIVIYVKYH